MKNKKLIVAIDGPAGSGKSTVATMLVRDLHRQGNHVLAIDADHNMDLAYALSQRELPAPYLGEALYDIRRRFGLADTDSFSSTSPSSIEFTIAPADDFTARYAHTCDERLQVMLTGPQPEEVLQGNRCSHSLASALKLYLPHLALNHNQYVVVDEKASVDAVSTGIPTGFDLAVIVVENKPQSIRVASQIAQTLEQYGVPYVYVHNKAVEGEGVPFPTVATIPLGKEVSLAHTLVEKARAMSIQNVSRKERSYKKFARARGESI
jgi:CO dehydrogenase nickel-insertion accessory protein CooC1